MRQKRPALGVLITFAAAILFGLNGSTVKTIMASGVTSEQVTLFRSLSCALIAAVVMLIRNPASFRVEKSEWKVLIAFGIAGVGLMQWSYANAVANLPVGIALLIQYTAIIWVPLVSIFLFKERVLPTLWLAVAMVLGGLVVVSRIWQGGLSSTGMFLAGAAALATTIYYLLGEHSQTTRDPISTLFYTMVFSSLLWFAVSPWWTFDFSRFASTVDLGGNLAGILVPGWILFMALGILGSFLPMIFTYAALGHLGATSVGIISTSETIFGFLFAYLWLGEKIDGLQTVGGLLVIGGIVIAQISRRAKSWQPSN